MQRVLAARGVASRRKAEDLIRAGRVSVDGETVTELGTRVDPSAQIRVDGQLVRAEASRYILLNKPAGFITTTSDEKGRDTVMNLVPARERVYPVGRLDRETEGLLLLTNDGDVAHRVMHPRYKLAKEYTILTPARPSEPVMARVRAGVSIDRRLVVPDEFRILRETREGVLLTITVHEGLNRVVRRMMEEVGIPIGRLRRVRIGPLALGSIALGESRELTGGELTSLLQALRLDNAEASHVGAASKSGRPKPVARGGARRSTSPRRIDRGSAVRVGDTKVPAVSEASPEPAAPRGEQPPERSRTQRETTTRKSNRPERGPRDDRGNGSRSGSDDPSRSRQQRGDDQSGRRRVYRDSADGDAPNRRSGSTEKPRTPPRGGASDDPKRSKRGGRG